AHHDETRTRRGRVRKPPPSGSEAVAVYFSFCSALCGGRSRSGSKPSRFRLISSCPCCRDSSSRPAVCASSGSISSNVSGCCSTSVVVDRSRRLRLLTARFARGNDVLARRTSVRAERFAFGYAARGTRAIHTHAGSTFARGRFELALAEYEHERGGIEDRVVAAGPATDEQREREVLQRNAAQCQQRDQRDDDGRESLERQRHRLQNRRVDDLVVRLT